ncbi:MAG TPA: FlgD immunoglobulin-like domain containing protein [Ignavibacteriaceae bacterium]|nr:FlgD immunoglobulin-like domain containing protein [Ignavibacteriaceae bacterium]
MQNIKLLILLYILLAPNTYSQIAQGPAQGKINNGVIVSTFSFPRSSIISSPKERVIKNKVPPSRQIIQINTDENFTPLKDIYIDYLKLTSDEDTLKSLTLNSFNGINQTNSIPPDPHIAVGPSHIIATVNSDFAIWDRSGNKVQQINSDNWYQSTLIGAGPFDPKVVYDHFMNKWVMVWLSLNESARTAYYLISVSDDSDPQGVWYNYAIPTHTNGNSIVSNWADYQGVGFDEKAIYVTSNQWTFDFGFDYAKIRIIPKDQIILNPTGELKWWDFWDVRFPGMTNINSFTLRPSIVYGSSNTYPIIEAPYWSGNFYNLYKITDPVSNPVLSGEAITIPQFTDPPSANQLGGGRLPIESGEGIQNEPTFRNGYLHSAHSIANPINNNFSSIFYTKINVNQGSLSEYKVFGGNERWHFYPALAVDKYGNVVVSYSRSSPLEYPGAFYSSLENSKSTFSGSKIIQSGKGNYVVDFGSGRNRWGDYTGIWLSPTDETEFYALGEFASATNTWGTNISHIRIQKYNGPKIITLDESINFGEVEIGTTSHLKKIVLQNFGDADVVISSITNNHLGFKLKSEINFPKILHPYDTLNLFFEFTPNSEGDISEIIGVTSNDNTFQGIRVKAIAYQITQVIQNKLYGITTDGKLIEIDKTSGLSTMIGETGYDNFRAIAINPINKQLFGFRNSLNKTQLYRINGDNGKAYLLFNELAILASGITFDELGNILLSERNGRIIKLNSLTGDLISELQVNSPLNTISFNLKTNEIWGAVYKAVGAGRDKIIKVNRVTGDTCLVGITGYGTLTTDLEFDSEGNLMGLKFGANQASEFFKIDTSDGKGSMATVVTISGASSLAYIGENLVSIKNDKNIELVSAFELDQNYPNPFNPSTQIGFNLPSSSAVKLLIYNMLGEIVQTLEEKSLEKGYHTFVWTGKDILGSDCSNGVYFYQLKIVDIEGKETSKIKKMIKLK